MWRATLPRNGGIWVNVLIFLLSGAENLDSGDDAGDCVVQRQHIGANQLHRG